MLIPRFLEQQIESQLGKQKVIVLYGTRRTGKTTIIESIAARHRTDVLFLQAEDLQVSHVLQERTIANYEQLTRGKKIIIIDEAQAIPQIGKILKLMIDSIKGITIIVTGSSSFDLANATGEPLVGRNIIYQLFPISQLELGAIEDYLLTKRNVEQRLIYGSYPELWHLNNDAEKESYLKQLVSSYLLKDLLMVENVKGTDVMFRLLQLLAWQIGNQVSMVELGNALQLNRRTVDRYMDLLTKVFIIFPLSGYSNNLRKEVTKSRKWYFYDNGIRNAVINNFSRFQERADIGQLWEQYMLSERMKYNSYRGYQPQYFFWRTYDGQEIDLLELHNQKIEALEFKWKKQQIRIPHAFLKNYREAQFAVINQDNYLPWITDSNKV